MSVDEIQSREEAMESQGMPYKIISIPSNYLDGWRVDYQIIPESFHQKDRALEEAEFDSEVQFVATLMPEFFAANKEEYLREKLAFRNMRLEDFKKPTPPEPPPTPTLPDGTPLPRGLTLEGAGGGGKINNNESSNILGLE